MRCEWGYGAMLESDHLRRKGSGTMDTYKYVIVGAGMAGGKAAEGIRKVDAEGSILVVGHERQRPYERPPLSKAYLRGETPEDKLSLQPADFYPQNHINLMPRTTADKIDRQGHILTVSGDRQIGYEKLLLATGGWPRRLDLPGSDLGNVNTLRGVYDCDLIRQAARSSHGALILGGSFIGTEVAASLSQLGAPVTVAFPGERLLSKVVPEAVSDFLQGVFDGHGVRLMPGATADRFEGQDSVQRAVMTTGEVLQVDLVVMGVGISLSTELAREAGLLLTAKDAVVVDEYLRTNDQDIFAAGDIAEWPDPTSGRRIRVEHWDVARRQGTRAGRNMAGEMKPYTAVPYFFSDIYDLNIEAWGFWDRWDTTVVRGDISAGSFTLYYAVADTIVGALTVGRPDDIASIEPLVRMKPALGDIIDRLRDTSFDLTTLIPEKPGKAK
jgi:3-phenylpropionate/trans-cinnamate dioxygenase ferredoxin reductase component